MAWLSVPSIPAKDQLSERTNDGRPPENASLDCVFTSTAAAAQGLTGIFTSGDQLKDIAKGEGYLGGGNEAWLVPLLARAPWHLKIGVRSGSQAQLIGILRQEIPAGHPCVVTIPSYAGGRLSRAALLAKPAPANPMHPGNSHCVLACGIDTSDSGDMVVMNPWHGWWERMPIAWWRGMICDDAVWPISKMAGMAVEPAGLPGWKDLGGVLTAPNGKVVVKGFRERVLTEAASAHGWQGGYPYASEWGDALSSRQLFAAEELIWTPQTGVQVGTMVDVLALAEHLREGKAA
ncbi:MAG TPA: hypothetical protein VF916_08045 [Ktedonobacterales bacterium]